MAKGLVIAVIGGGSSYTPELIEGLLAHPRTFPVAQIRLLDVEAGRTQQSIIASLARRMVDASALPIRIIETLDRDEALTDADFVITQFRVGRMPARLLDETIPARNGMLGQETVGIGGLFKALRTVPVVFDIIEDMKRLCPEAWLINFTNPAGIVSEAVFRYGDFSRFVGVCNVPVHVTHHLAEKASLNVNAITPIFAGLNHLSYVLHVYHGKNDVFEAVRASLGDMNMSMANIEPLVYTKAFIEHLEAIPGPYQRYYCFHEEMLEASLEAYRASNTRAAVVADIEKTLFERYKDPQLTEKPEELARRGGAHYSTAACGLMRALHNDARVHQTVIAPNEGQLEDLPDGAAIEVTARITKDGPVPVRIGRLPLAVRGLVQQMKAFEQMLADAIYERDLQKALSAWHVHPLSFSIRRGEQVFKELREAHRAYLDPYYGGTT